MWTIPKNIFSPITCEKWHGFNDSSKKVKGKIDGKIRDISIQKDILGLLAAKSDKTKSAIDIKKALTYPLAAVSLPLASADGTMRKTNKARLYDALYTITDHNITIDSLSGK